MTPAQTVLSSPRAPNLLFSSSASLPLAPVSRSLLSYQPLSYCPFSSLQCLLILLPIIQPLRHSLFFSLRTSTEDRASWMLARLQMLISTCCPGGKFTHVLCIIVQQQRPLMADCRSQGDWKGRGLFPEKKAVGRAVKDTVVFGSFVASWMHTPKDFSA